MRKIYVIDNSEIDAFVTRKLLEQWLSNVSVTWSSTMDQVVQEAQLGSLDDVILLMDSDTPIRMDVQFSRLLREKTFRPSIYILGHYTAIPLMRILCCTPVFRNYIVKPIDTVDVMRIAAENDILLSRKGFS